MIENLQRVCVKLHATTADVDDSVFVQIFHEWIRDRDLDLVLLDVADYTHVPESPGVMLVAHDASFALDRTDGRLGILVQRRRAAGNHAREAVATALRQALVVADKLEGEPRVSRPLAFDRSVVRIEANDRLRAPNTDEAYRAFAAVVRDAVSDVLPGTVAGITRGENDSRDRLAIDVRVAPTMRQVAGGRHDAR